MNQSALFKECEQKLAYNFDDLALLRQALTHSSGADTPTDSNERLEFLGDAVLGYVICELLFKKFPGRDEGDLTKIKSAVVSRETCLKIAQSLDLQNFIRIGRGVGRDNQIPVSILANAVEAIIAALYLDGGIKIARRFILQHFAPEVMKMADSLSCDNHKSMLQDMIQKDYGMHPDYMILDEKGPDHSKCFKIAVRVKGQYFPAAWGNTKKTAEQHAAENAICILQGKPLPYDCGD
ncbi:MAG: ribonuclease III [Planctomycetaceae bacterium]|nr:ribonuclease III [Planctomycetaceae bacterium]